ncbi:MAG: efflux RND transporter periplasmic adaptor subunit [Candidatus Omnitrophica bacterium]|jgi:multidrug efflux pump subunit AcrA (membrane-fusion protein)|nr:efflux RND transporter periplasmic adaptor subunit [Candidatus Omnitrophota bacterium]MDD3274234.1 efflux RND transporter periplasmic adaptor subunit [Candidatus Omnitrophota bacterium]MDD5078197.1 efflux RND transporter periplasmic adaptor subunit [Candidatus Omnitrophota bacterium]MDD5724645.1 efflux RND transporter periplasmic adaptor subunit [Candidatus Omnitrophota bacterium]
MRFRITAFVLFACLFLSGGCGNKNQGESIEEIPVKVSTVTLQQMDETIEYVGNIKAQDEAVVYSKVSGKVIRKIKEDGSPVKKGEAICYIDRDETGLKFEEAPVESPLTGVVGRFYLDIGANITDQSAVALVVNMDKVKIELSVTEKYLPRIVLGQEARISVDAWPGEYFTGKVTKISPVLDLNTRSAPIEITIDNPDHRLQSGMFARVVLILSRHSNVPVIIKESVTGKAPDTYVYIIEDDRAVLKKVSLGLRQGAYYAVTGGLKAGEAVVVMGQQRLFEGAHVLIEEQK